MNKRLKYWLKRVSPVALSRNHRYDRLVSRILKEYCTKTSNCVDIGSHEGEFLDLFIKISPEGTHFAFEPLPGLFKQLITRFMKYSNCHIYNYALSNENGTTPFNHVISNPAYSGIKKRKYDRENERDEMIIVTKKKLDDVIPANTRIDILKIDVEGGEYDVLAGSKNILANFHPLLIFEFGIGGSDVYGVTPEKMFDLLNKTGYHISLPGSFPVKKASLTKEAFCRQVNEKINYYFIAHSKK